MNFFLQLYPGDSYATLAVNVLLQVTVVILVAWIAAKFCFRRHAAVRHGLWLAALVLVLFSPVAAYLMNAANVRIVAFSLPEFFHEEEESAEVAPLPSNNIGALNSATTRSDILRSNLLGAPDSLPIGVPQAQEAFGSSPNASKDPKRGSPDSSAIGVPQAQEAFGSSPNTSKDPKPAPPPIKKISKLTRLRAMAGAFFAIWILGVAYGLVRLCRGAIALRRLLQKALPGEDDPRLQPIMAQIEQHLGLKQMPPVLLWRDAKLRITPLTVGIFRPIVVLSKNLLKSMTPEELYEVLLHECAHVLRRDSAVGLLQRIASIVFWPHPLMMLLNRQLTVAREEVCDNYVLRHTSGPQYAQTLFDLSQRIHPLTSSLAPVGLFQHHCPLEKRVAGLLDLRRNIMTRINRWAALCMAIIFLTISLAAASAKIQNEKTKNESKDSSNVAGTLRVPSTDEPGSPDSSAIGVPKAQEAAKNETDATPSSPEKSKFDIERAMAIAEERQTPTPCFFAWQDENPKTTRGPADWKKLKAWHVDGSALEDEAECRLLLNHDPGIVDLSATARGATIRIMNLWIFKPRSAKITKVSLLNADKTSISTATSFTNWDENQKGSEWCACAFEMELQKRPAKGNLRIEYEMPGEKGNLIVKENNVSLAADNQTSSPDSSAIGVPKAQEASGTPSNIALPPEEKTAKEPTTEAKSNPKIKVAGKCVDLDGKPVPDAEVSLYEVAPYLTLNFLEKVETDKQGKFSFAEIKEDSTSGNDGVRVFTLIARAKGKARIVGGFNTLLRTDTKNQELQMRDAGTVKGRIIDTEGKPIAGVRISDNLSSLATSSLSRAVTDADGRYEITDLDYLLEPKLLASHPDYVREPIPCEKNANPSQTTISVLRRASSIEGKVIDEVTGKAAANVIVMAESPTLAPYFTAITDAQGRYQLQSLGEGKYNIFVVHKDRTARAIEAFELKANEKRVAPDLKLIEGGFIEGRILDDDTDKLVKRNERNLPVVSAYSSFRPVGGRPYESKLINDGYFRLRVVPGMNYLKCENIIAPWIVVEDETIDDEGIKKVEVAEGQTVKIEFNVRRNFAHQTAEESQVANAIQRREINKLVKDFPEEVDLSSPESAFVSLARTALGKEPNWIKKYYWEKWDVKDAFYAASITALFSESNPISSEDKVLAVLTYRDKLAVVIATRKNGSSPTHHFYYGKIHGKWKILEMGDFASQTVEDCEKVFAQNKDAIWNGFQEVKKNVGDDQDGQSPKIVWPVIAMRNPLQSRVVNKLVKDFPEALDLSSPESACTIEIWLVAKKDIRGREKSSWANLEKQLGVKPEEMEKTLQNDPHVPKDFKNSILLNEILETHTYREDLALVVYKDDSSQQFGNGPYKGAMFGKIHGVWKSFAIFIDNESPNREDFEKYFINNLEKHWKLFEQAKKDVGDDKNGKSDVVFRVLPSEKKKTTIQQRAVNKLVKDFPEKTDLSTPESALAAYHRAIAQKDTKAVLELGWRKYGEREIEDMERLWKSDTPEQMEIYLQAVLDAEVREVRIYKDDLAVVIAKLKFPEGIGRHPFTARAFGRIDGQWKNLGENRLPSIEAARFDADEKKELGWAQFVALRDEIVGKQPPETPANEVKAGSSDSSAIGVPKAQEASETIAIQCRAINKLVKDFPEAVDLSSPEAACVACARAMAKKDVKTLFGDLTVYFEPEQIEKMEQNLKSRPPEEVAEICQTYNDAEILEVQAYREDFAEVILKIKIGKYFFTQNEGPYIRMPFGKFDGKWKGLHLPQEHAESVEAAREQFARSKDDLWKKYLELKKEARKAGTPSPDTLILMGLVENYFAKNAKEITARKTIEWGEVRKNADGSRSIRYKYEAKYVDKDAATANQIFTFDQDNVLLGVKDVEEFPQKTEKKAEDKNANNKSQEIDKRWSWLMGKSGASERNEIPLKHAEAALEIAEAELKISLDANRKVPETVPLLHIQKLELKYQLSVSQAAYYKAVWAGDEKQAKKFALDNVNDNIQYLKNAIELEKLSSKRDPSGESPSEAIEKLQTQLEKAIEDGKRANAIQYPPINAPTNYKIDSPHSPKPNFINREAST